LDTSALFAAVFSDTGGARMILRLAEGEAIELVISSQVLAEAEGALRRKAPHVLGHLALLLDRARCQVVATPTREQVLSCQPVIEYLPDAAILAAALGAGADYLVTHDRQHFLENPNLLAAPPIRIGTPGDLLAWLRQELES
jgi:predicted nucleic acid-binding protein